ncbi:disintegrin and metalloproteinase domain-containing protein 10-like [Pecten maximus]|uniref:disintegrin and metalloproteinase domain-containing protein 10-like n=1 Tax=Pecten maximus TaxID=6579 RepID=UPI001458BDC6|nr:disintegrin and metalloproteinase domain-containing protein 10-like [Pecten maximus]
MECWTSNTKKTMDLLCLVIVFCSYGIVALPLNDVIRHYEQVHFDSHAILSDHHRVRRGTDDELKLTFRAFDKDFRLNLRPNNHLFTSDVVLESSTGSIVYDTSGAYTGSDEDDIRSRIYGVVTSAGHFEGQLVYPNETYNIEGSRRHFHGDTNFSSIIYRSSDVSVDTKGTNCKSDELHQKLMKHRKSEEMHEDLHKPTEKWSDRYRPSKRQRRAIDPAKTVCEVYLKADHTFFNKFVTNDAVLDQMTNHVQASNNIFTNIDFDGDGSADGITFQIKRVTIYNDPTISGYPFPLQYSVESMLDLHSRENYNDYCLAILFTYRDFSGVLGLAWTAELGYAGGVCEKSGTYHSETKSLNTALVTLLNYGRDVSSFVSHATFAHEVGHNFGSQHDPENQGTCSPGSGNGGNFIMFPMATSGHEANNQMFSSCSVGYMSPILTAKARDTTKGCFKASGVPICGNNVVETGEECDCGWSDACTELCCNPQSSNPSATPCTKVNVSASSCSPSEGPCCSPSCVLYTSGENHVCRTNSSCLSQAQCEYPLISVRDRKLTYSACDSNLCPRLLSLTFVTGTSASCPASTPVANGTQCAEGQVCYMGECSGSVCLAHSLESCQCSPTKANDWKDEKLCEVCCVYNSVCTPSTNIPSIPKTTAVPGSPCNDYKGYCDVFNVCQEVDPTGPLLALKKLLLDGEVFQTLKTFLTQHWYIGICAAVVFVIILILVAKFCSKSHGPPKSPRQNQVEDNMTSRDCNRDIDMYNIRRR